MTARPRLGPVVLATTLGLSLVACAPGGPRTTFPPIGVTPLPAGGATTATVNVVVAALAASGLQALETPRAYRPPEGALFAAAPRTVLQVTLPADPTHGFIVIYAFASPAAARAAGEDHAAYLASNPGRIQFLSGTDFVLRAVGSSVVFFHWVPESAPDPGAAEIARILRTIGTEVPAPN